MQYRYGGIDHNGQRVKGRIVATTLEEAKQKLRAQGVYYDQIKPARTITMPFFSGRKMPGALLSGFARELSSYLASGMTIPTALKLMENQHQTEKRYAAFLSEIRQGIEEGKALHQSLADQEIYRVPNFLIQSLHVAGQSGKVAEVLGNMGAFFSLQSRVRKQVANAMAYPLFIFVVAMGMAGFLVTYVVPKITGIFEDTGQELPGITRFVLGMSDFLSHHWVGLLLGLFAGLLGLKFAHASWRSFRYWVDRVLLKIPILGSLIQNHELARFSYILALMLDSGVSYAQAVSLASTTFGNSALRASFEEATQRVMEGNKLSNALYTSRGLKPKRNFMQSLALGEESGELASVMLNLSSYFSEENEERIKLLLSLLEPVMMLLIGAVVGTIVMAMLLPIFSMNLGAKV